LPEHRAHAPDSPISPERAAQTVLPSPTFTHAVRHTLYRFLIGFPPCEKNRLARRMLPIMHRSLDLNHFEEFTVERESACLVVLRCARFKVDFTLGDVCLIPLNREHFSDPHAGVVYRDEHARPRADAEFSEQYQTPRSASANYGTALRALAFVLKFRERDWSRRWGRIASRI
jgi:hypothetical protein